MNVVVIYMYMVRHFHYLVEKIRCIFPSSSMEPQGLCDNGNQKIDW